MMANNIFDDLFSKEELDTFKHVKASNINVEQLKTTGTIKQERIVKDGLVHTLTTYNSFDGKTSFQHETYIYEINEDFMRVCAIRDEICAAIEVENYELAAELKKEKDILMEKLNIKY